MNSLLKYFFRGLLLVVPIVLTVATLVFIFNWLDSMLPLSVRGVGFFIIIFGISLIGLLTSKLKLLQPFVKWFENTLAELPVVGLLYSSFKELVAGIVGEQQKFTHPVLVRLNAENEVFRIGFITQHDLTHVGIDELVAVFFPHSYNISGNLYLVPRKNIQPLPAQGAETMRFLMSGGVVELNPHREETSQSS
ncbi:MAG: DUF502 domain-containing protein [Cytophagales bacterium]|nr:DUF502 domain-containing protein [Bernardetiaceae bacterium]MDW8204725.1 DUF502 domain-containing protein [Cytophagales bacterium]